MLILFTSYLCMPVIILLVAVLELHLEELPQWWCDTRLSNALL